MSEISKIYKQYQESLKNSQGEYEEKLKHYSKKLKEKYDELIKNHVHSFSDQFKNQIKRLEIKNIAEQFFETSDIPFVAIDASCHKQQSANFISFYGGAYGSKGTLSLSSSGGKIKYDRWEFNKDVSMVAFVPIPPDMMHTQIDESAQEVDLSYSDSEIADVSSLHTKIMQLAEIFLAYSLARLEIDCPKLILIDNSISGIMGNTSYAPNDLRMKEADFNGESLSIGDLQIALAHPFNQKLGIPSTKRVQPHFRLIAEAVWKKKNEIKKSECSSFSNFEQGANFLDRIKAGKYDSKKNSFKFNVDPQASWYKCIRIFEHVCDKLFKEKDPKGICYKIRDSDEYDYFSPRGIVFLSGVGLRALIELCWKRKILLVGIVKDSSSRYWYRNYLGSVNLLNKGDQKKHFSIPLTDRTIMELLPNIDLNLNSPWTTLDYDSCFMTLHSEFEKSEWKIKGYHTARGLEVTRPERIFLKSLAQFFLSEDKNLASHALFVDRLAYPDWDDKDSDIMVLDTGLGKIYPLQFNKEKGMPRLQVLTMYLMSVLVRNHFPEALGYPDPLHQADWGAKSLKKRVLGLLDSSEWAFKSRPLSKTFRTIRDSFR